MSRSEDILDLPIFFGEHLEKPPAPWDPGDEDRLAVDIFEAKSETCVVPTTGMWKIQSTHTVMLDIGVMRAVMSGIEEIVVDIGSSKPPSLILGERHDRSPFRFEVLDVFWSEGRRGGRKFFSGVPDNAARSASGCHGDINDQIRAFRTETSVNGDPVHELLFVHVGNRSWLTRSPDPIDRNHSEFSSYHWLEEGDLISSGPGCKMVLHEPARWIIENQNKIHEWFRYMLHGTDRIGVRISKLSSALKYLGSISKHHSGLEEVFRSSMEKTMRHLSAHNPWYLAFMLDTRLDDDLLPSSASGTDIVWANHPCVLER